MQLNYVILNRPTEFTDDGRLIIDNQGDWEVQVFRNKSKFIKELRNYEEAIKLFREQDIEPIYEQFGTQGKYTTSGQAKQLAIDTYDFYTSDLPNMF